VVISFSICLNLNFRMIHEKSRYEVYHSQGEHSKTLRIGIERIADPVLQAVDLVFSNKIDKLIKIIAH